MMTTSRSERGPDPRGPIDDALMRKVHGLMLMLGETMCELSDRMTPEQEYDLTRVLPHFSSILTDMALLLDLNAENGFVNMYHPTNLRRRGNA